METSSRSKEEWSRDFEELRRRNEEKKQEEKKAARRVQGRLLALCNMQPGQEVVVSKVEREQKIEREQEREQERERERKKEREDPEYEAKMRLKELDRLEHAKEKAEYAAILKQFNIVELPPRHALIDLVDSDTD